MNYDDYDDLVQCCNAQKSTVEAIKFVHKKRGWGLKEAKEWVERNTDWRLQYPTKTREQLETELEYITAEMLRLKEIVNLIEEQRSVLRDRAQRINAILRN